MNANRVCGILGALIWLMMLQTALGVYNPNTGREFMERQGMFMAS